MCGLSLGELLVWNKGLTEVQLQVLRIVIQLCGLYHGTYIYKRALAISTAFINAHRHRTCRYCSCS